MRIGVGDTEGRGSPPCDPWLMVRILTAVRLIPAARQIRDYHVAFNPETEDANQYG